MNQLNDFAASDADAPVVEATTQAFLDQWAVRQEPPIYAVSLKEARRGFISAQPAAGVRLATSIEDRTIASSRWGQIALRIVSPLQLREPLPVVMYFHGGGW